MSNFPYTNEVKPSTTAFLKTGERVDVRSQWDKDSFFVTIYKKDGSTTEDLIDASALYTEERLARAILWDLKRKEEQRDPEREALNQWVAFCMENKLSRQTYRDGLAQIRQRFHEIAFSTN